MFSYQKATHSSLDVCVTREIFLLESHGKESFITAFDVNAENETSNPRVIEHSQLIDKLHNEAQISLIDERVLVKTATCLVWQYTPSSKQPLYYQHKGSSFAAPIQWCNFVFKLQDGALSVVVSRGKSRINGNTKLYHAPLPNVYESAKICLGSCTIPNSTDIDQISEAYFNSTKTHFNCNKSFRSKKKKTPKEYAQWLKTKVKSSIKVSELTSFGTLNQFISK